MTIFQAIKKRDITLVIQILEENPTAIHELNDRGATPLIYAVYMGNPELVASILDFQPDLNAKDNFGYTALMGTCMMGFTDIVRILLEAGTPIDTVNRKRVTALMIAASFNREHVVRLLMDYNANKELRCHREMTAYEHAMMQGVWEIANFLR